MDQITPDHKPLFFTASRRRCSGPFSFDTALELYSMLLLGNDLAIYTILYLVYVIEIWKKIMLAV